MSNNTVTENYKDHPTSRWSWMIFFRILFQPMTTLV